MSEIWKWIVNIFTFANKIDAISKKQDSILSELADLKSPNTKLQELNLTIDIINKKNEAEKKLLMLKGTKQGEEDKKRLLQLEKDKTELLTYKQKNDTLIESQARNREKLLIEIVSLQKQLRDKSLKPSNTIETALTAHTEQAKRDAQNIYVEQVKLLEALLKNKKSE